MNIIEAWGSGIPKIFREAKEYGLREPKLIDMGSDFRINLYRKKAVTDQNGVIDPKKCGTNGTKNDTNGTNHDYKRNTNEEIILCMLQDNPQVTQNDICGKSGIPLRTVKRLMNNLKKDGKIRRRGSNRNGSWIIVDPKE